MLFQRIRRPWRPPGQYGAGTQPMAASSGFEWSPGCDLSGDAPRVVPLHCHGNRNCHRFTCIFCCVSHNGDGDDHGVRQDDMARAHARWCYLVALHEATNTLYREMCLAPYLPSGMVVAIAVESTTLYYNYIVFNRLTSFYFITQLVQRFKLSANTPPPRPTP